MINNIQGKITISRVTVDGDESYIKLTVYDSGSKHNIVNIDVNLESFARCLTGEAWMQCVLSVNDKSFKKIGKKRVSKVITANLGKIDLVKFSSSDIRDLASIAIYEQIQKTETNPDEWEINDRFSSKDSFIRDDCGNMQCRTTAYKWE